MKPPKPIYLPEPPTFAELERHARHVRLMHILMWVLGMPMLAILLWFTLR
jgi:hypothetical protein